MVGTKVAIEISPEVKSEVNLEFLHRQNILRDAAGNQKTDKIPQRMMPVVVCNSAS